jgi:hypothetical protein
MAFKMKGPTFFNVGKKGQYEESAAFQQKGKLKKGDDKLKKGDDKQTRNFEGTTEGQDTNKIYDEDGNHVGDYVNGKAVYFNQGNPPYEAADTSDD